MTREEFAGLWVYHRTVRHMFKTGIKDPRLFERIRSRKAITQIYESKKQGEKVFDEHNGNVEHLLLEYPTIEEAYNAIHPKKSKESV